MLTSAETIRASPFFDEAWYRATNPDVAAAGINPAQHYLEFGWLEGREPSPDFSGRGYLRAHADVRESGLNPLLHYILYGQHEGRLLSSQHEIWAQKFDSLDEWDRSAVQEHIAHLSQQPLISITVPVYRTNPIHLKEMLASVFGQSYSHWELCIADDNSCDPELSIILEAASTDSRVRLSVRDTNGNISEATNTALSLASGEWVCLVDHDDLLNENALYEIAVELNTYPEADIIYTDCDSIDDAGLRFNPFFKPDWNYDLMLGQNIVNHLSVFRRSLVQRVGGMRVGFEGSQDYDLALRVADETEADKIRHIPAILYHWRRSTSRASFSDSDHDRCVNSARHAIADHLSRRKIDARVEACDRVSNFTKVVYPVPSPAPLVTVCIASVNNTSSILRSVFDVLFATAYEPKEILVVQENPDPSLDRLARANLIRIVPGSTTDPLAAKSAMVAEAKGDVVVLLDSNLQIGNPEWMTDLVSHALRDDVGAAGPLLSGTDGRIQDAGIVVGAETSRYVERTGDPGYFANMALTREVTALPVACLAFRRSAFASSGGLERRTTSRETEVHFGQRLRAIGLRNILVPYVELTRSEPPAYQDVSQPSQAEDPFYNPNLSLNEVYQRAVASRRTRPWQALRQRLLVRHGQRERSAKLLVGIDPLARLLEVGASYSPIAPRSEGWNTKIVDHASRERLVQKYKGIPNLWVDRIEEVDYIWVDGPIAESIPRDSLGTFDYLIASHVIEHIPDLISLLQSAAQVLKEAGEIILAVPDKRFCFDYFRQITMTGEVIEAYLEKRTRHTRRTAFEHLFHTAFNRGEGAWGQEKVSGINLANTFDVCISSLNDFDADTSGEYIDYHAWRFVPSSFELLILELARLNYTDWVVNRITPAIGCEFHVRLRRGGAKDALSMSTAAFDIRRLELLQRTLKEIGEQANFAGLTAESKIP